MNGNWSLLVAGSFGLLAAWVPIGLTSAVNRRQERARLAAVVMSELDRLYRATAERRSAIEGGQEFTPGSASYDDILPGLHRAVYELQLISRAEIRSTLIAMQELADQLVFSTLPALASDRERDVLRGRFTDRKIELIYLLAPPRTGWRRLLPWA